VRIAGQPTDPFSCTTGVAFFGSPGTGKSVLMEALLGDVIQRGDPAIVTDLSGSETDVVEWKASLVGGYPVDIFDPFVIGSGKIWFPDLVRSESGRMYFASKIFPDIANDPQPFFNLSARELFFVALCVLAHYCPDDWELADVVRLVFNRELFAWLAARVKHIGDPFAALGDSKGAHDVHATARMRLAPLKTIAALMLKCDRKIDILRPKGAVVLRARDRDMPALERLLAFIFDVVADYRLEEPRQDLLWMFMDEVRQLAEMACLSSIMRRGRKCGIVPVLGIHEIDGIFARYGKEKGAEILALIARKVFLRQGSERQARWCAEQMGQVDSIVDTLAPRGEKGTRRDHKDVFNVTPDELRRSPLPTVGGGAGKGDTIVGHYDGPDDSYRFETPWLADVTPPKGWKPIVRKRRPPEDEILKPFTAEDFNRLKFPADKAILAFIK
jgi:hypothetical protein